LATDGRKIEAIKVHRRATGLGLAEAKAEVEAFMDGGA
jgi:ribosomal protein L7/L12